MIEVVGEALLRVLGTILAELLAQLVFSLLYPVGYAVGWGMLKAVTLGRYPSSRPHNKTLVAWLPYVAAGVGFAVWIFSGAQ